MRKTKTPYTLFFWIGILLILGLNLLLWIYVNQVEEKFASNLSTRLTSTNKSLARLIDEDLLGLIIPGKVNTLEYFSIYESLSEIRRQDSLQSVFILSLTGQILVASPEIIGLQKRISNTKNRFFTKAKQSIYSTSSAEQISSEWFMSSYGPITNIDGQVVAILIIEAKATYFETLEKLRNRLFLFSLINIIVITIIAIFLFRLIDRAFKYQATIKDHEHLVQLGTMGASVAHEIRNPLGIIAGSNELIKKKYGKNDDEIFDYIPDEIRRLTEIIENFLNFARAPKIRAEKFSIEQLIDRIKIGINPSVKLDVDLGSAGESIILVTDESLLEQTLLNIIKNAIEAGGNATQVSLSVKQLKNFIQFTIKDNGPGIEPDELDKLFQPFYTTKEKGTGLGLAISKRIVELLDGTITVNSVRGDGAEFEIKIPLNKKKRKKHL